MQEVWSSTSRAVKLDSFRSSLSSNHEKAMVTLYLAQIRNFGVSISDCRMFHNYECYKLGYY